MKDADVEKIVSDLAYTLKAQGVTGDEHFIVDPMTLFFELQQKHPDVVKHIRRYHRGDPYQQIKVWIPTPTTHK